MKPEKETASVQRETYYTLPNCLLRITLNMHALLLIVLGSNFKLRAMCMHGKPSTPELGGQLFLRIIRCCLFELSKNL